MTLTTYRFRVEREAQPQPRPRARILGRPPFNSVPPIQIYTGSSEKVALYKGSVKEAFALAYPEAACLEVPFRVSLRFVFKRPLPRLSEDSPFHLEKPDLDNLAKGTLDALNGLVWADDSQVVSLFLSKAYGDVSLGGKSGRKRVPEDSFVEILIEEIDSSGVCNGEGEE